MTKKDIVRRIAAELDIDQTLTRKVVQNCLDTIIDVLTTEGRIELRNFGVFEVKTRAPRKARNPKTNQVVHVPAKQVITFTAGKNISRRLQQETPAAG